MKDVKRRPYIGITDFTDSSQILAMAKVFSEKKPTKSKHMLQAGVMMSQKTLNDLPTKSAAFYPKNEEVAGVFGSVSAIYPSVYTCLHYEDQDYMTGYRDLLKAVGYAGPYLDAMQLDMTWPNPAMISTLLRAHSRPVEVILKIGKFALESELNDPDRIVRSVAEYMEITGGPVIHRVMLDRSGKGFDPIKANELLPHLRTISKEFPTLGLGVAGGLGPRTVDLVQPVLEEFPDVSVDARACLRSHTPNVMFPIDWELASLYVSEMFRVIKPYIESSSESPDEPGSDGDSEGCSDGEKTID
jgi:hypothetical protein